MATITVGIFVYIDYIDFIVFIYPFWFLGYLACLVGYHSDFVKPLYDIHNIQMLTNAFRATVIKAYHLLLLFPGTASVDAGHMYVEEEQESFKIAELNQFVLLDFLLVADVL